MTQSTSRFLTFDDTRRKEYDGDKTRRENSGEKVAGIYNYYVLIDTVFWLFVPPVNEVVY